MLEKTGFKVRPFFNSVDFRIGFFYDSRRKILYFCPLPYLGLALHFPVEIEPICRHEGYDGRICGDCGQLIG